jgi:hypothetical protein
MPVYRYRDVSEMEDRSWRRRGDPELLPSIRRVWAFAQRTTRPRYPPGVHKHRSAEAAEALRESWERSNFEAFRERRSRLS